MFPILPEPEPSVSDIIVDNEPEEEPEPPPQDELKLAALRDIQECFGIFDPTDSGTMDLKYLDKAFRCLGIYMTSTEIDEQKNNLDKGGVVLFDDFQAFALEKMSQIENYEALKDAFQVFDPDNEGIVPTDRFRKWMTTLGDPLTEKEAKELTKMGDPANKGIIAYDDLIAVLALK